VTTIRTEDGAALNEGDRAYNYYDMKPGTIRANSLDSAGWFDFDHDDGSSAYLDGSRICSTAFATRKGWA
jgi:hypothetical protein